jgi:hypothetical protein
MATMVFQMKVEQANEGQRAVAGATEWAGIGWTDSSWELAHGLEVVEDLPADAWPMDVPAPATRPAAASRVR